MPLNRKNLKKLKVLKMIYRHLKILSKIDKAKIEEIVSKKISVKTVSIASDSLIFIIIINI